MFEKFIMSVINDKVRNEDVFSRAGIERELSSKVDSVEQRVLRWVGHMESPVENA